MNKFMISICSGLLGVFITIGYQHYFAKPPSFTFIYNGEEIVVSESTYTGIIKENEKLKNELAELELQTYNSDDFQQQTYKLLKNVECFSKTEGVYSGSSYENIDNYDNVYASCIYGYGTVFDNEDPYIEYHVGKEYTNLSCTVYVVKSARTVNPDYAGWDIATLSIYGDDVLLYTCSDFSPKYKPIDISVDISNVEFLKICFLNADYPNEGSRHPILGIGNPTISYQ